MHMENILGIFFLIYAWVLPQKKWNQNPLAWGQAAIFLESSLSDSNVQARVRTTALILGGPSVLLALVASAAADGVLDMPTLSLAPGPESEPVCSQDSQTAAFKFEKYCFGIIDDFLAAHTKSMEKLLNVQLLPQRFRFTWS